MTFWKMCDFLWEYRRMLCFKHDEIFSLTENDLCILFLREIHAWRNV